jgi:hypothetical protein
MAHVGEILSGLSPEDELQAKKGVMAMAAGAVIMTATAVAEFVVGIPDALVVAGGGGGFVTAVAGGLMVNSVVQRYREAG